MYNDNKRLSIFYFYLLVDLHQIGKFLALFVLLCVCVYTNHRTVNHLTDPDSYMHLCSRFAVTATCSVTAHLHQLVSQITHGKKRRRDFWEYSQNTLTKLIVFFPKTTICIYKTLFRNKTGKNYSFLMTTTDAKS